MSDETMALCTIEVCITLVPTRRKQHTAEKTRYLADVIRFAHAYSETTQAQLAATFCTTRLFVWEVIHHVRFTDTPNPKYPYSREGY